MAVLVSASYILYVASFAYDSLYVPEVIFYQLFKFSVEQQFSLEDPVAYHLICRRLVAASELEWLYLDRYVVVCKLCDCASYAASINVASCEMVLVIKALENV